MAANTKRGPLVRGLCPAGHLVETRAPYRRLTWRGPCPHKIAGGKKCGLYLTARRTAEQPEPTNGPLETEDPSSSSPSGRPPVRKVARYVDHGIDPARPDEPGFAPPAEPEPIQPEPVHADDGGEPGVSAPQGPSEPEERPDRPGDDHPPPRPRRGLLGRTFDRWRAPGLDLDGPEEDWTVPGIYP